MASSSRDSDSDSGGGGDSGSGSGGSEPAAVLGSYTAAHHEEFMAQGFLQLGPLLPPEELQALSARLDEVMLGKKVYEGVTFQLDPGGS